MHHLFRLKRTFFILALLGLSVSACFKKGEGKGSRKTKPSKTGDVFVPGPGGKPPETTPTTTMSAEAREILAECFAIPVEEVQDVPGWTDPVKSVEAAKELCAKLASVNFDSGTVNQTAVAVEVE
jgi:hypothetical protein